MLYLKYRPLTISQLDNSKVRRRMEAIAASLPLPHAFLLVGPKGTGKTSTARIIAKIANCPRVAKKHDACGECEICTRIANGAAMDLIEIDAASNRGIDDIRSLRQKVNLLPSELTRKVYIIDEVHMLTREAFNALLKTLEEPPEHVGFVLCTTEPEKVPATIRSRCLEIKFRRATRDDLVGKLLRVAEGEGVELTKAAAGMIADEAGGSFRDGIKLLEQLAETHQKVDERRVEKELTAYLSSADKLYEVMLTGKLSDGLAAIGRVLADEVELVGLLRSMASRAVEEAASGYLAGEGEEMVGRRMKLSRALVEAYAEYQQLPDSALVLKRLALNWFASDELPRQRAVGTGATKVNRGETMTSTDSLKKIRVGGGKKSKSGKESVAVSAAREPVKKKAKAKATKTDKMELAEAVKIWGRVMEAVKPQNHSVGALLRSARIVAVEDGVFKVEVFYRFHKDRLESSKCRQIVESCLAEQVGSGYRVEYFLGQKPQVSRKADGEARVVAEEGLTAGSDNLLDMAEKVLGS